MNANRWAAIADADLKKESTYIFTLGNKIYCTALIELHKTFSLKVKKKENGLRNEQIVNKINPRVFFS